MKRFMLAVAVAAAFMPMLAQTAAAVDYFGAIAFAQKTRSHGYSYDYTSQTAAEQAAMAECAKRSTDCSIATWFRNACGALAVGKDNAWGAHWGTDEEQAKGRALQKCYEVAIDCKVERSACTKR